MRARIFISHSTKTGRAQTYLKCIERRIKADPRFELLLDVEGLKPGDDWRHKIFKWMDEADGAVIVISKEALQSNFVPIELSILSFRHCRDVHFALIVVMMPDVDAKDLEQGVIGEINLKTIQHVRGKNPEDSAINVVTSLAQILDCGRWRLQTPLEMVEDEVARCLRDAEITEADLEAVGISLPVTKWVLFRRPTDRDLYPAFARVLLKANCRASCQIIKDLARRRSRKIDSLRDLLPRLAPFWVNEVDARPIAEAALAERERRLFGISVDNTATTRLFIARSCLRPWNNLCYLTCQLPPPDREDAIASSPYPGKAGSRLTSGWTPPF